MTPIAAAVPDAILLKHVNIAFDTYSVTIDLASAFLSIPIRKEDQKPLVFL